MTRRFDFSPVFSAIKKYLQSEPQSESALQFVCGILAGQVPHYDWVGLYFVDSKNRNELVIGPYVGEPTEHVRIPFGEGICGQAAEREQIFVVPDVSQEINYLSCSPKVRSEIVVPIFKNGIVVGELDIDSHQKDPFTDEDERFLKNVCQLIAPLI